MTRFLDRVDRQADILKYLGLNPDDPASHALYLVCQRYGLDPLLNLVSVIKTKRGNRVYITRDGMLDIAHRSGQLDGIVVDDQHETENGYSATVSVWRKDMTHPFTFKGGCGIDEPQAAEGNGPEMALARAERRALKRAFAIPLDETDEPEPVEPLVEPVEHRMLDGRDAQDQYRCSCGQRFSTIAAFHAHQHPGTTTDRSTGEIPGPASAPKPNHPTGETEPPPSRPAGPGPFKRSRKTDQEPPASYYDDLPEARGLR